MSSTPIISTIIVSYNTAKMTCDAIQSVVDEYQRHSLDGEIIVIDNRSKDDSVVTIREQFGNKVQVFVNKENLGFAQANNQGMKVAKGKYFFLLNSDTIVHPHAIHQLLNVFEQPEDRRTSYVTKANSELDRIGLVAPKLLRLDGSIQPQGGALPNLLNISAWWLWPFPGPVPFFPNEHQYQIQSEQYFTENHGMGWVSGAALLIKREVIEEIGGLDENIFMYGEDVELCLRAHQHHWGVLYYSAAEITHIGSASSSTHSSLLGEIRGLTYMAKKHFSPLAQQLTVWVLRAGTFLRWLLFGIILKHAEKKALYLKIAKEIS